MKYTFPIQTVNPYETQASADTMDVFVCGGDTIVAEPLLDSGLDTSRTYSYFWTFFPAGNITGNTIDSGYKLVKDIDLTISNTKQPAGVYVYILDATLLSNEESYKKHGPVALLR